MARIRTVKPDFFRHERLYDAERRAKLPLRLAFAGLWTAADREGRFKWAPRTLKLDCLPYDDVDFGEVLSALVENGFIQKYEVDGEFFGVIPSWRQHQVINQRESQSVLPDPESARMCVHVHARGEEERKGREGKEAYASVANATPNSDFEEFWKAKPRRAGADPKAPAEKLFRAAVKAGTPPKLIIAAAKRWAVVDAGKIGTEYLPQAVKWLRDKRWNDYQPEDPVVVNFAKFYAKAESDQLAAWDAHFRAKTGKNCMRDKNGGWYVDSEWPPGYSPPENHDPPTIPAMQGMN